MQGPWKITQRRSLAEYLMFRNGNVFSNPDIISKHQCKSSKLRSLWSYLLNVKALVKRIIFTEMNECFAMVLREAAFFLLTCHLVTNSCMHLHGLYSSFPRLASSQAQSVSCAPSDLPTPPLSLLHSPFSKLSWHLCSQSTGFLERGVRERTGNRFSLLYL
jgi:hypothetical protein